MTEEEKQEQFMLLLLRLATRYEREIIQNSRLMFLQAMRDLRRLVQRMSPDGEFRAYEWRQLQLEALPLLNELVVDFGNMLMPELVALEEPIQEFAQDYADEDKNTFTPLTEQQLLENVFIDNAKIPLWAYLIYNGRLARKLQSMFQNTVDVGLLRGDSTQKIADNVLKITMKKGRLTPVVRTGSFAAKASTQLKNTLDGAVWGTINQNVKIAWQDLSTTRWVWNAVLDSKTCPVCAPLNGKLVTRPPTFVSTGFSRTLPPVHPNCRCVILPVL